MVVVPPVAVGAVELAEDLLGGLRGQVGQPRQVRAGLGQVAALPDGAERHPALAPGELPLRQR